MPKLDKALLLWDGDCGFCRRWVERWKGLSQGQVDSEPYQLRGHEFKEIDPQQFKKSVVLVYPDGRHVVAAQAAFEALQGTKFAFLSKIYTKYSIFSSISEKIYSIIAKNRVFFSYLDSFFISQGKHSVSLNLFFKGLGSIYLIAFLSLWIQIDG